jgi:tetratricopeptide (TPR) repeat protein
MFGRKGAALERRIREQEKILRRTSGAMDAASVERRGLALWRIAGDMADLGRFVESEQYFRGADHILWPLEPLHPKAVSGRHGLAVALMHDGRFEDALSVIKELIDRLKVGVKFPEQPDLVPISVGMWLYLLERLGRVEEAAAVAAMVIHETGSTPYQQELVANAFRVRGVAAQARGDREAALAAFEEAAKRCDGKDDDAFKGIQAKAMARRAAVLADAGRMADAIAACNEVLDRFGSEATPLLHKDVTGARQLKRELTTNTE